MTTATTPSAYPASIEDLLPEARRIAEELGDALSQTKLRQKLRIGGPKARHLMRLLAAPAVSVVPQSTVEGEPPAEVTEPSVPREPVADVTTDPDPVPPTGEPDVEPAAPVADV